MNTPQLRTTSALYKRKVMVCDSADLSDRQHRIVPLLFKNERHTAVVLRHEGRIYVYLNQCVHMVRRLDCIHGGIFDEQRNHLRCSMHGITYDPTTGASLSVLCSGQRLQSLRSAEVDGRVYITDKRAADLT